VGAGIARGREEKRIDSVSSPRREGTRYKKQPNGEDSKKERKGRAPILAVREHRVKGEPRKG